MSQKEDQIQRGKYGIELDQQAISLLKEVEGDPTLEDCVCRDIWDLQQAKKLNSKLQKHAIDQQKEIISFNAVDNSISNQKVDVDDLELEQIRQRRIQQLKSNFQNLSSDFELVLDAHNLKRLIKHTQKLIIVSFSSLQIHDNVTGESNIQKFSNDLKLVVKSIANLVVVNTTQDVLKSVVAQSQQMSLNYDLQIICFLNGKMERKISVNRMELNWLDIGNQISSVFGFEDEENYSDDSGDEWSTPCLQCGRKFPHEHIKDYRVED